MRNVNFKNKSAQQDNIKVKLHYFVLDGFRQTFKKIHFFQTYLNYKDKFKWFYLSINKFL